MYLLCGKGERGDNGLGIRLFRVNLPDLYLVICGHFHSVYLRIYIPIRLICECVHESNSFLYISNNNKIEELYMVNKELLYVRI